MKLLVISIAAMNGPHRRAYGAFARDTGAEVHIVSPGRVRLPWSDAARHAVAAGPDDAYVLHTVDLRFPAEQRLHWYRGLRALVARLRPDYVFAEYDPGSWPILHAALPRAGQKVVAYSVENILRYRLRDAWRELLGGRLRDATRDAVVGLLSACGARVADGLACISPEGRQVFETLGWSKPLEVIPLGTDTGEFCPGDAAALRASLGLGDRFVVGYFGRLVPQKGVHVLVEAMAAVPDAMLMIDTFENAEADGYAARIEAQVNSLGLGERVCQVHPEFGEMPAFMRCCDVIATPSIATPRWKEQFGRVLPEAMATGIPVIGTTSGNIPDLVGDAGVLVPESDAPALGRAINALRDDPHKRQQLASAGRARVEQHFSIESQVRGMRRLFEQL